MIPQFCVDGFVAKRVTITEFDRDGLKIKAKGIGEVKCPWKPRPKWTREVFQCIGTDDTHFSPSLGKRSPFVRNTAAPLVFSALWAQFFAVHEARFRRKFIQTCSVHCP